MQDPTDSAADDAISHVSEKDDAEILEWIGTSYGRLGGADRAEDAVDNSVLSSPDPIEGSGAASGAGKARVIFALALFAAAGSAFALVRAYSSGDDMAITARAADAGLADVQVVKASESTVNGKRSAQGESLRAVHEAEANDARSKLALERDARLGAEQKAAQLGSELAAATRAREAAEQANTETSAQLETARKARTEAEEALRATKEELARRPSPVELTPVAATSDAPQQDGADSGPSEAAYRQATPARVIPVSAAPENARAELLEGQKLFAKGDLEAARQLFERAAAKGLPEGALATGTTFDPVSLTKAGLEQAGDPARARQWYRRAHELAQGQRESR